MPLRNVVVIALSAVISLACYSVAAKNRYANLFAEALHVIDQQALRQIETRKLFDSAMAGMMTSLDEHSMYISGEMYRAFDEDMKQEFGGVGMYVETDPTTDRLMVLSPIPDTPAFHAGIQIGDEILEIDGIATQGLERADAIKLMRGPKGTDVTLLIRRRDQELPVKLVRAIIPVPSVHGDWRNPDGTWNYFVKEHPRIGYLRLIQFGEKSTAELEDALTKLDGNVDGLVLDLRNNSGGLLDAAIDICDMFLNERAVIVKTRGRDRKLIDEHYSSKKTKFNANLPLAILVNRHSASASEIVAACLQDHGRAIVIGERTWGKGTVQNIIPVERGQSALKLTTASYWRPGGQNIDRYDEAAKETGLWGVQPNVGFEIQLTEEMVFDNIRQRNRRELQGLSDDRENENRADEDSQLAKETRDAGNDRSNTDKRHIDLPMQRAIEYLKSKIQSIAA